MNDAVQRGTTGLFAQSGNGAGSMWHFVWVCVLWVVTSAVVWGAFRAGMVVADSEWRSHGDDLCRVGHKLISAGRVYYVLREEDYVKLVGGGD